MIDIIFSKVSKHVNTLTQRLQANETWISNTEPTAGSYVGMQSSYVLKTNNIVSGM